MTVKELIKQLQKRNENDVVLLDVENFKGEDRIEASDIICWEGEVTIL